MSNYKNHNYQRQPYRGRKQQDSPSLIGNIFTQLGKAIAGLWRMVFKGRSKFNSAQLLAQYATIEKLLESGDSIHASQAVIQADSFLDSVMKKAGGRGESFGQRLRSLESKYDRNFYQQIWNAHKLRNLIAHQHPDISVNQARSALQTFRRAASALGAF